MAEGTKPRGATYSKSAKRWQAQASLSGRTTWLGYFATAEEAGAAYRAARKLFPDARRRRTR